MRRWSTELNTQHRRPRFSLPRQTYDYGGERLSRTVAHGVVGIHRATATTQQRPRNDGPVSCCRDHSCVWRVRQLPGLLHTPLRERSRLEWIWKLRVWRHIPAALISFASFVARGRPRERCLTRTRSVAQGQVRTAANWRGNQARTRVPCPPRAPGQSTVVSLKGTERRWPPLWSFRFLSRTRDILW